MPNILVLTQKVDINDDVLSFFHRWLVEFSKHADKITVICLYEGQHSLPSNVSVISLGKESGLSRGSYLINFYRHIWQMRHSYSSVFVHMNQEYVILGSLIWKILGKKIMMWRNHYAGNFMTLLAVLLSDDVFCTSRYSFTARFKKTSFMPVGIDTDFFSPRDVSLRKENSLLFLARISPSKRPDLLIEALHILKESGAIFTTTFYGNPTPRYSSFFESIKEKALLYNLDVSFIPGIANDQTLDIYRSNDVFINTSPSGMFDKTILEAMASGCLTVVSSKDLLGKIDKRLFFKEGDASDLARALREVTHAPSEEKEAMRSSLRRLVVSEHSLHKLGEMVAKHFV